MEEIVDILIEVAPTIGLARLVPGAVELALALGYDIDRVLEGEGLPRPALTRAGARRRRRRLPCRHYRPPDTPARSREPIPMSFFELSTVTLAVVLVVIVGGAAMAGMLIGRVLRSRPDANHQPVGVVQGTLLGLVGLLLAFGLTMAVGRYDNRRSLVVQESNDIGTTYLRAQLLAEPVRTTSLALLEEYADVAIDLADQVPDTDQFDRDVTRFRDLQRELWATAGEAVRAAPADTAPRLYIETLNAMIDTHTSRVTSLRNRVPDRSSRCRCSGVRSRSAYSPSTSPCSVAASPRRSSPQES